MQVGLYHNFLEYLRNLENNCLLDIVTQISHQYSSQLGDRILILISRICVKKETERA